MIESNAQVLSPSLRERIYRRNFSYFLIDGMLFYLAMGLIGSTTVIPDFVRHLTDSEILIGLAGSLFSIGFTLPQLLIARYIVRHARKKWWFVGPNIPVRFVILIFAVITVWLGGDRPGLVLVAFFVCYSIAAFGDGLVGVPWADLIGTSLDSRWRARMFGITSAGTGLIMLSIAPLIGFVLGGSGLAFPNNYAVLFGASGLLFAISILPGLFFHELPGGKAVEKLPSLGEFLPDLGRVLRDDMPFRAFIILRMFTSLFMMAFPFYIGFATVELGLSSDVAVPMLLAMQTAGTVGGARPLYLAGRTEQSALSPAGFGLCGAAAHQRDDVRRGRAAAALFRLFGVGTGRGHEPAARLSELDFGLCRLRAAAHLCRAVEHGGGGLLAGRADHRRHDCAKLRLSSALYGFAGDDVERAVGDVALFAESAERRAAHGLRERRFL